MENVEALKKAIKCVGTAVALAKRVRVSPQAIQYWLARGVPAKRVLDVVRATDNQVTCHELRPDLYPPELAREAE